MKPRSKSRKPKRGADTDYDNPWKSIIERYFREFIQFFFPWIEAEIDWSRPVRFMDKELQKITWDAKLLNHYADKLAQVYQINGKPRLVLCHVEVQSQYEKVFPKRVFVYNYRLRDRYDCPVVSLVILGDESKQWRPNGYADGLWGCSVQFEFPVAKLLDYGADWAALEASENPFAVVVMAHLKTKETHGNAARRKEWKYRLTTMLYERGYGEQDILELYQFLDWLMRLPQEVEAEFQSELAEFEEARQMKYVTAIERMAEERGEERGEQKGRQETQAEIALKLLQENIPLEIISRSTGLTIEQIQSLQTEA